MNSHPICSENELRCRSGQNIDCESVDDPWNSSLEDSRQPTVRDDALQENSYLADVQYLQDVEPTTGVDAFDGQTNAPNKRQLFCVFFSIYLK